MQLTSLLSTYPRTFWIANIMELFERLSYYGMFIILANYLTGSTEMGALGFSQTDKAILMGSVGSLVYLLPVVTGAIADHFGFRRVLIIAYLILGSGY
jgi:proton-dependent oligopeptide transporter, POT family